jgi:hypothetical protein
MEQILFTCGELPNRIVGMLDLIVWRSKKESRACFA